MIYLDNSATSPVDGEVLEAMLPYLKEEYGNPSGKYYCQAENAHRAVEEARNKVAQLIGAESEEIIFTSGSTESSNLIIKGFMDYSKFYGDGKNHIITSNAEHKATMNICHFLAGKIYSNKDARMSLFAPNKTVDRGYEVTFLEVNSDGVVETENMISAIQKNTAMASFIYVNNETGSMNDIEKIADICQKHNIKLHIDATQALGKMEIDVKKIHCDFMSLSAHKIYGPKGIGCAYIKSDGYGLPPITALLHGGLQEKGIRGGTLAVHNIVGFGKACEIAWRDWQKNQRHIYELDDYLIAQINQTTDLKVLVSPEYRMKGIVSILVERRDFNNERFIKKISDRVAISTGSACSAGQPSHVITAVGQGDNVNKILRVSLNKFTQKSDIDVFMNLLTEIRN